MSTSLPTHPIVEPSQESCEPGKPKYIVPSVLRGKKWNLCTTLEDMHPVSGGATPLALPSSCPHNSVSWGAPLSLLPFTKGGCSIRFCLCARHQTSSYSTWSISAERDQWPANECEPSTLNIGTAHPMELLREVGSSLHANLPSSSISLTEEVGEQDSPSTQLMFLLPP